MADWTPEPLQCYAIQGGQVPIVGNTPRGHSGILAIVEGDYGEDFAVWLAAHIAACVNACAAAGLEDPEREIPELQASAKTLQGMLGLGGKPTARHAKNAEEAIELVKEYVTASYMSQLPDCVCGKCLHCRAKLLLQRMDCDG